jgi:WD40 repeat protein
MDDTKPGNTSSNSRTKESPLSITTVEAPVAADDDNTNSITKEPPLSTTSTTSVEAPDDDVLPLGGAVTDWNFTEEELLAALAPQDGLATTAGFGDDDQPEGARSSLAADSDWLPEIPFADDADWQATDGDLLTNVFDDDELDPHDALATTESFPPPTDEETATLALLDQLEQLQLDSDDGPLGDVDEFEATADGGSFLLPNGDVPAWLYCHPCQPQKEQEQQQPPRPVASSASTTRPLAVIVEDDTTEQFLEPWKHASEEGAETDIDSLLQQLHLQTPSAEMKHAIATARGGGEEEAKVAAHPRPSHASLQTLLTAFGVNGEASGDHQKSAAPPNERQCLGHRERVLGVDVSEDGRYFATASGDSTVRVWQGQRLLATLRGHDTEHECLRVMWASASWAAMASESVRLPLQPGHDAVAKTTAPNSPDEPASETIERYYWLVTGGADGVVYLWAAPVTATQVDPVDWRVYATLDHSDWAVKPNDDAEEPDKPQIYALAWIDDWQGLPRKTDGPSNAFLLTSSDDHVHLWEWPSDDDGGKKRHKVDDGWSADRKNLREVLSIRFGPFHGDGYGVTVGQVTGTATMDLPSTREVAATDTAELKDDDVYGGKSRNPHGIIYVFDAAYSTALSCLAVALSDGTVRLLNGRGVCWSVLSLPHAHAHLTALAWSSGHRLATAVATGEVVTWEVHAEGQTPVCRAILAGGHEPGRPLFGVAFYGSNDKKSTDKVGEDDSEKKDSSESIVPKPLQEEAALLSWGVDGRLCLWESASEATVEQPTAVLVNQPDFPLYAVACTQDAIVAAGGGSDGGFVGIPVHWYDLKPPSDPKPAESMSATIPEESSAAEEDIKSGD